MNANDLTIKEIQFNIMVALMNISGSLSDMVTQGEAVDYSMEVETNDVAGDIQ